MKEFTVTNWIELGIAVTESSSGDSINIISGTYPTIPIKENINVIFPSDFSVKVGFLPLQIGLTENYQCGSININNTRIHNINQDPSIIKGWYIYRKELPFEVHTTDIASFIHPNGSIIVALGNNKRGFEIGPDNTGADKQLPKGVVEIRIPFTEDISLDAQYNLDSESIHSQHRSQTENEKINAFENQNNAPIINLNDFEYRALWALNSFIIIYGGMTSKQKKVSGYSTAEFRDGLISSKFNDPINAKFRSQSYIDSYSGSHEIDFTKIQHKLFSKNTFSLNNYIEGYMHKLNYAQATILMDQRIEEISKDSKNKYEKIESLKISKKYKQHLLEIIIARNSLLHRGSLSIQKNIDAFKFAKKNYPNLVEVSEFEIFALKRPWYWFEAFQKFNCIDTN